MTWKPHVTVAAVIHRQGRFLMVEEEADGRLVLNQPAGHLEAGESVVAAAVRETLEETAWRLTPEGVVGVYRWSAPGGRTYLRLALHGTVEGHDPERPLDDGIRRALWLDRAQLAAEAHRLRSPMVARCVDDYLAGRRYPLELLHDLDP